MGSDLFYRATVIAESSSGGGGLLGAALSALGVGGPAYDLSDDVSSLTVEQTDTRPDSVRIEVADQYKVLGHALQEGMKVEVELGTDDSHAVVFRGRIYKVAQDFPLNGIPRLTLHAYDDLMKLGLRKRNRAIQGTLKDVVNHVINDGNYGFGNINVKVGANPKFGTNGIRQQDWTDLEFLQRLANMFGCVMYVQPGAQKDTFNFVDQLSVMTGTPSVNLFYGRCDAGDRLLSFQANVDVGEIRLPRVMSGTAIDTGLPIDATPADQTPTTDPPDSFFDENMNEFRSHDPLRAGQLQSLLGAASGIAAAIRTERGKYDRQALATPTTPDELMKRAQSQFSVSLQGMTAHGTCLGVKELIAGSNVGIQDVGSRFSGKWFLSRVTHVLNKEGYRNEFECRK